MFVQEYNKNNTPTLFDPDVCLGYDEQAMNVTLPHPSSSASATHHHHHPSGSLSLDELTNSPKKIISPFNTTSPKQQLPPPPTTTTIPTTTNNNDNDDKTYTNMLRKASVAVAGTALIGAGIPLIPLPGPGDFMVVGGLALLATEFPAAQRVIDKGRDKLVDLVGDDDEDDEEDDEGEEEEINFISTRKKQERQELYSTQRDPLLSSTHQNVNRSHLRTNPSSSPAIQQSQTSNYTFTRSSNGNISYPTTTTSSDIDDAITKAGVEVNKAVKRTSKSLKKFTKSVIIPMMNHIATTTTINDGETELSTMSSELGRSEVTVSVTNRSSDDETEGTTTRTRVIVP